MRFNDGNFGLIYKTVFNQFRRKYSYSRNLGTDCLSIKTFVCQICEKEGIAYKINQNLDKINKGCKADVVTNYGDIWKLTIGEQVYFVKQIKELVN